MKKEDFHTFSEYMKRDDNLSASMEDYLEMIYRLSKKIGFVRIHDVAGALNVQPPSVTKMVQKLSELKLVNYEKYGIITLTETGKSKGRTLLDRHNTIEGFLRILGISSENILEETEKIEHTISSHTVACFSNFIDFIRENPDVVNKYEEYLKNKIS